MPVIKRSALVEYSAQQMFDLVNDIASYPAFMAGCVAAEVLSVAENSIEARLTLGVSGVQQSFVTRNELSPPSRMVMRLVEGPFRHFEGLWSFDVIEADGRSGACDACKVSLVLDFAFKNPLLGMAAGRAMEENASRQVDSLCRRADEIYG